MPAEGGWGLKTLSILARAYSSCFNYTGSFISNFKLRPDDEFDGMGSKSFMTLNFIWHDCSIYVCVVLSIGRDVALFLATTLSLSFLVLYRLTLLRFG